MQSIAEIKKDLRKEIRRRIQELSPDLVCESNKAICRQAQSYEKWQFIIQTTGNFPMRKHGCRRDLFRI